LTHKVLHILLCFGQANTNKLHEIRIAFFSFIRAFQQLELELRKALSLASVT
jgi:hypothetical protein